MYLHKYLNVSENILNILTFQVVTGGWRLNFPDNAKLAYDFITLLLSNKFMLELRDQPFDVIHSNKCSSFQGGF